MRLVSTRREAPPSDIRSALFRGPAPDGGLYRPASLPRPGPEAIDSFREAGWLGTAAELARLLLAGDWDAGQIDAIVRDSLDFPVPLRRVGERIHVLELFHGPTLAFKDVGARFLARAMASVRTAPDVREPTVLVATSGDTGSAVGDAFRRLTDFPVVVLYPEGRIGPRQERHLTGMAPDVTAVAVDGTFDDCQELVKLAFGDEELRERARLTSANSINIGRLLPQIFYYFHALARLDHDRAAGVLVSVPSGNLGNVTAGLMAKRMGLPADRLLAATNRNDALPRYLATGRFEPRPAVSTPSSAMDVGEPSNLERLRDMYGDDPGRLGEDLGATSHGDEATRRTVARVHDRHGYLLDPHAAVGWRALEEALEDRPDADGIVLATAHPAKFPEVVAPLAGGEVDVPERWSTALSRDGEPTRMEPDPRALRELLLDGTGGGR